MGSSGIENITIEHAKEIIGIVRPGSKESRADFKILRNNQDYLVLRWHPHMVEEFWFFKTRIAANCNSVFSIRHDMETINFDLVYKAYNRLKELGYKIPV